MPGTGRFRGRLELDLKATTEAMLPRIDLPDLRFEVHSWTGFLDAFGHVSERRTRMEGLLVSLVALLVSPSCNIGLTPVIDPENKALTRSRLSHVDQNYVRADTIAAANAALITAQSRIELAHSSALRATISRMRTWLVSRRSRTGTSTAAISSISWPVGHAVACAHCVTRTRPKTWTTRSKTRTGARSRASPAKSVCWTVVELVSPARGGTPWRPVLAGHQRRLDFRQWSDGARCPYRHLRGQQNDQP
jgi:hypothetical protein